MNNLLTHIEYLLTQTDCVIVPGFGGFVLRDRAALFVSDGRIMAPGKAVSFNASLCHNDGLLAGSLMREKGVSFAEATVLIDAMTREVRSLLTRGEQVSFGSVGSFKLGDEGELLFTPAERNLFALGLFGFDDVMMRPLEELAEPDASARVVAMQPAVSSAASDASGVAPAVTVASQEEKAGEGLSARRLIGYACAVAVLFVGVLCATQPLERGDVSEHRASLVSSSLLPNAMLPDLTTLGLSAEEVFGTAQSSYPGQPQSAPADSESTEALAIGSNADLSDNSLTTEALAQTDASTAESPAINASTAELSTAETSTAETSTAKASSTETPTAKASTAANIQAEEPQQLTAQAAPMKRYYIVVGSFPTEEQAVEGVKRLEKHGLAHVAYLQKDNKFRLYIDKFTDKEAANAFLERFRAEHPEYMDAWLLAHKS